MSKYSDEARDFADQLRRKAIRNIAANAEATRLSVNVNQECAAILKANETRGVSYTDTVRQALSIFEFVRSREEAGVQFVLEIEGRRIGEVDFYV